MLKFYFRFRFSWLRAFRKVEVYMQIKFRRDIWMDGWDITISVFWNKNVRHVGILLTILILCLHHRRHVILHLPAKIRPNQTIRNRAMTSYVFLNGGHYVAILLPVSFFMTLLIWEGRICLPTNFGEISQSTAVSEKQTSAMLEFTFGFGFHLCVIICMSFCVCLPNFAKIGPSALELWRHSDFQDDRRRHIEFSQG